jgi:hypothetical protein
MLTGGSIDSAHMSVQKMRDAISTAERARTARQQASRNPAHPGSGKPKGGPSGPRPGNNSATTCRWTAADCKDFQENRCKRKHPVAAAGAAAAAAAAPQPAAN